MLKDSLDTPERRNDVHAHVVELPELPVVSLRGPPEGAGADISTVHARGANSLVLEELVLLPVRPHAPSLVVRERVSVLLEERVAGGSSDPVHDRAGRTYIRGIPRSHESSRSSSVRRRFCAFASLRFIAYSDQTRAESRNSASHGWMYR